METLENTRKLNETLVSIKAQLRGAGALGTTRNRLFSILRRMNISTARASGDGAGRLHGANYSQLGEGECLQSDGSYPIKFSIGYGDLRPHTTGTNAQQAVDRCKAKCIVFAWCLAAEVVLRDIWPTPECRLITDWNAYVVESTNTFQNNNWGGTQMIDGEYYQTYCNGGQAKCSDSNVLMAGASEVTRDTSVTLNLLPHPRHLYHLLLRHRLLLHRHQTLITRILVKVSAAWPMVNTLLASPLGAQGCLSAKICVYNTNGV